MPPGSAKSTYASVRFPAYFLGRKPDKNIICASYGENLATSFGRKVRNLLNTKEYRNVFDIYLAEDSQAKGEWETNQGGSYFAAGVGSGITGRRGDLGLIDDPVKGRKDADSPVVKEATWEWYRSDFLTRLKPGSAQIIIQTRWTDDDLSGRILPESWDGQSGDFVGFDGKTWKVIALQAQAEKGLNDPLGRKPGEWLWTDWFTGDYWEDTKAAQQSTDIRNWNCLFQQRPAPEEGTYFKRDWFKRRYDRLPDNLNIFITHDDAVTESEDGSDPDHTEIAVWGVDWNDDIYVVDWWNGQETQDVWVDKICDFVKTYKPFYVVGEGGVIRRASEPYLIKGMETARAYSSLEWLPTIGDKQARARSFQALSKLEKIVFPESSAWHERVLKQLIKFPSGHDDAVDACGLIGRTIHETWASARPKQETKKKRDRYAFKENNGSNWKTL